MKVDPYRILSVTTAAILLAAVGFAFFASPHIGSAYLSVIKKLGTEMPIITKAFSLALMGIHDNPLSAFPERPLWAWCLWLTFFCWPIALMIWAVLGTDFERSASTWCLGVIAYLSSIGTVAVIGIIGLLMPFTKL